MDKLEILEAMLGSKSPKQLLYLFVYLMSDEEFGGIAATIEQDFIQE